MIIYQVPNRNIPIMQSSYDQLIRNTLPLFFYYCYYFYYSSNLFLLQ